MDTTMWVGRAAAISVGLTGLLAGVALFGGREQPVWRFLAEERQRLDRRFRFLRSPLGGMHVLAAQGGVVFACFVAAIVVPGAFWLLLAVPAALLGPRAMIERRVAERITILDSQIEPWLGAIANALKASASLGEAIAASISLVQAPMSEEVDVLVKEYELGTPLDRALENFGERMGSETVAGTVLALQVARRSGGNLPEMLESAAKALRELARLEGVVRTKTAEGRAQAFVIAAIPAPMVLGMHWLDPQFFQPLVSNFLGNLLVAGAAVLWGLAIFAARKILAVDV